MMRIKIQMPDGKIIERTIKSSPLGNFSMNVVRIANEEYLLGSGDEYMRGYETVYEYSSLRKIKDLRDSAAKHLT